MVITDTVKGIFADAKFVHFEALKRLEAGDIREASEKAWCATKRATDALLLKHTGIMPLKTPHTSREPDRLANQNPALKGRCPHSRRGWGGPGSPGLSAL